jgi:hypothetical protein
MDPNPELWLVTQVIQEQEMAKAKRAKAEFSGEMGEMGESRRRIGFLPG